MKTNIPEGTRIANCLCCTLATSMRDCSACPFNVGLVFKSLQALAKVDRPVNLEFQRAQFVARIQEVNYA